MECKEELEWTGLYHSDSKYKRYLDPKTYAHPAKMSMDLCNKIFQHLEHLGLLKKDDVVVDFMSGTGRTNVIASINGYRSIGVELESHFIDMEKDNKAVTHQSSRKAEFLQEDVSSQRECGSQVGRYTYSSDIIWKKRNAASHSLSDLKVGVSLTP